MAKSYEELMGALGRAVFFRPERRRVRDLLSREAQPQLLIDGEEHPLFDLSLNGVSFLSQDGVESWPAGRELDVTLLLHRHEVYRGRGRVARVEAGSRKGARVGLGLVGGFLDLPEILHQDEEGQLETDLRAGPEFWRTRIPQAFQDAVGRAVHFLHFYRRVLDRGEARYRARGVRNGDPLAGLADRALAALREPWAEIQRSASRAAVECLDDRQVLLASKRLTETLVTPVLLACPIAHRAYTKPLGYAGDYKVMQYYYNNALEGESVFAQVFHKFGVEHPLSAGVRTRKDYVVRLMEEEHRRYLGRGEAEPVFRVASLGCGPAREVSDFIARRKGWPGQVAWTLIDQEDEALSIAYNDSHRQLQATGADGVLQCLHLSFVQIIRDPSLLPIESGQHFIFATGLFDYLGEAVAQVLVRTLFDQLAVGGLIALGNALGPNDHFWSPEFILDWTMLYRTREEMLRLGQRLPETAEVSVEIEPGNAYYFLLIRKH
jgi:extracellular factor (EF) 3-hydroxypalmitic acid methyl ester biosynthesis protein